MHVQVDDGPRRVSQSKLKRKKLILMISIAGFFLCMIAGIFLILTPTTPEIIENVTEPEIPHYNIDLLYDFGVLPSSYNQHIVKIEHRGGDVVENMSSQLWISMYPPDGTPYLKRASVLYTAKYLSFEKGDVLYIYLGKDQNFYASKELPTYSDFVDFPNGAWGIHIDDGRYKSAMSTYSFTVFDSKTKIVNSKTVDTLSKLIDDSQPYDTIFVVGDQVYHEQILMDEKSVRLFGVGGPIINAGGINSAITISNCSYGEIRGFEIQGSGTLEPYDAGITIKNSNHISIYNNSFQNNQNGIYLSASDENDIRYNSFQVNDLAGILLEYGSSKNTIKFNYAGLNTIGIYLRDSSDNNYVVLNTGAHNSRYGILIENKLKNMYEYNNFSTDRMSYNKVVEDKITYYSQDKTNESAWLAPDRVIGRHESVM